MRGTVFVFHVGFAAEPTPEGNPGGVDAGVDAGVVDATGIAKGAPPVAEDATTDAIGAGSDVAAATATAFVLVSGVLVVA